MLSYSLLWQSHNRRLIVEAMLETVAAQFVCAFTEV